MASKVLYYFGGEMRTGPKSRPVEERFWEKVDKNGPIMPGMDSACWVWIGYTAPTGYGRFWHQGKNVQAHRFAYELVNGPIPDGKFGCHECDNPSCVNPSHVWPGTCAENLADMVAKDRQAKGDRQGLRLHPDNRAYGERNGMYTRPETRLIGESHHNAKLSEQDVRQIRLRYTQKNITYNQLALEFDVCESLIEKVVNRKAWKHI